MGFRQYQTSVAAAVATNGTFTFSLANAADWGTVKLEGGHVLYAEGLQAAFTHPTDFTLSASGATVTVTYKGTTSIPAGSVVRIQLETPGENNYLADGKGGLDARERGADSLGNPRWSTAKLVRVFYGAPAAASATSVVNASARTGTNTLTTYASPVKLDAPRTLQYKSSNVGDTTQTVTVRGTDEYGVAVTETVTLNGTTVVNGKKAFQTVISDTTSATLAGNLSIGTLNVFGLPFFLPGGTSNGAGYVVKQVADGAADAVSTTAGGDLTVATATTGDVRGTITFTATPDGSKALEALILATDVSFKGVAQFGA
jgi:hypothetical protein